MSSRDEAAARRLVSMLSSGDGGPSVISGGRRLDVPGGRAVVVGTGGFAYPGRPGFSTAKLKPGKDPLKTERDTVKGHKGDGPYAKI